jgi:hypothetical protein
MNEDGVVCRLCVSVWQGVKDLTVSCSRITASLSMEFIISGMPMPVGSSSSAGIFKQSMGPRKRVGKKFFLSTFCRQLQTYMNVNTYVLQCNIAVPYP